MFQGENDKGRVRDAEACKSVSERLSTHTHTQRSTALLTTQCVQNEHPRRLAQHHDFSPPVSLANGSAPLRESQGRMDTVSSGVGVF